MSQPEQQIRPLSADDRQHLTQQRAVAEKFLDGDEAQQQYLTPAGKLGLIQAILDHKVFAADQAWELQCLGVILGDAFVQHLGMEWMAVDDEDGHSPAVQMPRTSIILVPVTMIHRRVLEGQDVNVFGLFNNAVEQVNDLVQNGV